MVGFFRSLNKLVNEMARLSKNESIVLSVIAARALQMFVALRSVIFFLRMKLRTHFLPGVLSLKGGIATFCFSNMLSTRIFIWSQPIGGSIWPFHLRAGRGIPQFQGTMP